MSELSDHEIRIISAVESFWKHHQKGPSYVELAEMVGPSTATIWRRVQSLVRKGIIIVEEGKHRTISLVPTSYTAWEIEMNNGNRLIIACETEERARELVRARYYPNFLRFFITNIRKTRLNLKEMEEKTGGDFELIARVENDA